MRRLSALALGLACSALALAAPRPTVPATASHSRALLLTGEVVAADSQPIIVPASNSAPTNLRNFVPEGAFVRTGDLVLRIDPRSSANLDQLQVEMAQTRERTTREAADLDVKQIEAERQLALATAALARAKVDAALPRSQITVLDYDRYQGELDRATRDLELRKKGRATAVENVGRRLDDGALALKKQQINFAYARAELASAEVRATQDGYVVHGYAGWSGERYDEGGDGFPGAVVAQLMGSGRIKVIAWALEADRPFLALGQAMQLHFDALPAVELIGKVASIASAPESRASWGDGRYFKVEIALPADHGAPLVHGMSALIEPITQPSRPSLAGAAPAAPGGPAHLKLEGEIQSRSPSAVAPPPIHDVWQFNLVALAPEGSRVTPGQAIATFESSEVVKNLDTSRSAQKEKRRALEKLVLDHAEAARSDELAVNEAQSNAEKAQRKARVPKQLVRRIDFDKLIIDSALADQLLILAQRQRDAQNRARKAEFNGLRSEIAQLQSSIDLLAAGMKALTVLAPRSGMVLHKVDNGGSKVVVGSQIFRGRAVATLADPERLYVSAKVPEAQSFAVKLGQRARVNVPGANVELGAKVVALGRVYHGKSSSQPIIVRDVELEFDALPKDLKPGAAVQVNLSPATPGAPSAPEKSIVLGKK
jgi:multidrug resistance efflux pump